MTIESGSIHEGEQLVGEVDCRLTENGDGQVQGELRLRAGDGLMLRSAALRNPELWLRLAADRWLPFSLPGRLKLVPARRWFRIEPTNHFLTERGR